MIIAADNSGMGLKRTQPRWGWGIGDAVPQGSAVRNPGLGDTTALRLGRIYYGTDRTDRTAPAASAK